MHYRVHYVVDLILGFWQGYKVVVNSRQVCDSRAPSGVRVQPWSIK